jgi:hypothetical protein
MDYGLRVFEAADGHLSGGARRPGGLKPLSLRQHRIAAPDLRERETGENLIIVGITPAPVNGAGMKR